MEIFLAPWNFQPLPGPPLDHPWTLNPSGVRAALAALPPQPVLHGAATRWPRPELCDAELLGGAGEALVEDFGGPAVLRQRDG